MKKIIISLLALSLFTVACDKDRLTEINSDPNSYYEVVPSAVLTSAQKSLSDYMNIVNVNINNLRLTMQYFQEVTYTDESNYDFSTRNVANQVFNYLYVRTLKNLEEGKKMILNHEPTAAESATWETVKTNQLAIIDLLQVYTYQTLVDTFGSVPYKQALDVETNSLPAYEDGMEIYKDLITRVQADIAAFDTSGDSFEEGEKYYNGDVQKWKIFGNTLLLKLGIAIADADSSLAKNTIIEAMKTSNGGVFASEADDCLLEYFPDSPNTSPIYENTVLSGRNDYVGGAPFIDEMLSSGDVRISKYFADNVTPYVGGVIGEKSSFSSHSHAGEFAYSATTPGILLNYTETAFYLAEAAARWSDLGLDPALEYENAVRASFRQWGFTNADADAYLVGRPFDLANWKKSIGMEAWIAMYNQPMQAWNFYRRLDYPQLQAASKAVDDADGKVPVRLKYPVSEQSTNPSNYDAASSAIGGDHLYTKIFWDKF